MSARAAEPPYSIAGEAREEFASGEAASEFNSTLYQPSHGFATSVHGFATKTNALACEIPPATQASVYIVYVFKHQLTKHRFVGPKSFRGFRKVGPRSSVIGFEPITSVTQWWHRALYRCRRGHVFELRSSLNFSHLLKLCRFTR